MTDLYGLEDVTPKAQGGGASIPELKAGPSDLDYILNRLKMLPGTVLGSAGDVTQALSSATGGLLRTVPGLIPLPLPTSADIHSLTGAEPKMGAPSRTARKLGILAENLALSAPFAVAALPARGILGAATELGAGLGGGVGQLTGEQIGTKSGVIGNLLGTAAGFRAGNIIEHVAPIASDAAKAAFGMMKSSDARVQAQLKTQGYVEGTPEYQEALKRGLVSAKNEILSDIAKAYAKEDLTAVQRQLDQYEKVRTTFPGMRSSLGEITGNEAVLGMQAKLESQNIPALEERGARIRANEQAIASARPNLVPSVPGAGRAAMRGVQDALDAELANLGKEEAQYGAQLAQTTAKAEAAAVPRVEAGTEIKQAAKEGYAVSKAAADKKYQDFRSAIGEDAPVEIPNVTAQLKELQDRFVFDKQPEVLGKIPVVAKGEAAKETQPAVHTEEKFTPETTVMKEGPQRMTVAQLDDLSSAANRDIQRIASMQNPDRKAIAQLQAIKGEARSTIETALAERGNTEALAKYREANRYFGEEHAPKYLEGVNLKLRLKDVFNEERIKPEDVVRAYFHSSSSKGATTEARRFNIQFADNGGAKELLARGVFDLYKREVIDKTGTITAQAHDAFMRKYAAPLAEYPWIASRLDKNAVAGEIAQRMAQVRERMDTTAKSALAKQIGTRDVDGFLDSALADKRLAFNAMSKLDKAGRRDFAIAILNRAWNESGAGAKQVEQFLQNENNVKMIFRLGFGPEEGPRHLNNLKLLAAALRMNEAAPSVAPMKALSEDTLKAATGTTFVQVMSALRSMGRRPGSGDWFAMVFGAQYVKAKIDAQKSEILKQQLFEPQTLQATLAEAKARSAQGPVSDVLGMAGQRAKQLGRKFWDLSKAALGAGVPEAIAKRPFGAIQSYQGEEQP